MSVPEYWIGDGYCDDGALNEACNFDRNPITGVSDCCGYNGNYCQYCYCTSCTQFCENGIVPNFGLAKNFNDYVIPAKIPDYDYHAGPP